MSPRPLQHEHSYFHSSTHWLIHSAVPEVALWEEPLLHTLWEQTWYLSLLLNCPSAFRWRCWEQTREDLPRPQSESNWKDSVAEKGPASPQNSHLEGGERAGCVGSHWKSHCWGDRDSETPGISSQSTYAIQQVPGQISKIWDRWYLRNDTWGCCPLAYRPPHMQDHKGRKADSLSSQTGT